MHHHVYMSWLSCTLVSSELGRLRQALPAGAGQPDHRWRGRVQVQGGLQPGAHQDRQRHPQHPGWVRITLSHSICMSVSQCPPRLRWSMMTMTSPCRRWLAHFTWAPTSAWSASPGAATRCPSWCGPGTSWPWTPATRWARPGHDTQLASSYSSGDDPQDQAPVHCVSPAFTKPQKVSWLRLRAFEWSRVTLNF